MPRFLKVKGVLHKRGDALFLPLVPHPAAVGIKHVGVEPTGATGPFKAHTHYAPAEHIVQETVDLHFAKNIAEGALVLIAKCEAPDITAATALLDAPPAKPPTTRKRGEE